MRRFAPQLFAQLFYLPIILFSLSAAHGQVVKQPASREQVQNRGWVRGRLTHESNNEIARQKLLAELSVKNDFRKLQIVNNQLMVRIFEPSASTQKISNKEIRSSLGEISKLAERLRSKLPIPRVEPADQPNQFALAQGLLLLDQAVMSFAHNPLFRQSRVFDVELALQAGRDLNEVLRLVKVLRELAKED